MNDALKAAATVDPDWAKKEQRRQWLVKVTVAGTLLALAVGAIAFVLAHRDAERITRVEQSACQENAGSYECQHTKLEAEKKANLRTTCEPFFKAGYACPKPGSPAAERQRRRQAQAESGSAPHNGGSDGATAPTPTGSPEASAPPKGGSGGVSPAHPHLPVKHPTSPEAPETAGGVGGEGPPSQGGSEGGGEAEASAPAEEGTTASSGQGLIPETVTAAGEVVEHVEAEVLAPTLCTVRSLLKPCP